MPYLRRKTVERERVIRDILIKPADKKKIESTLLKSRVIVPTAVAQQLSLRVSIVKRILAELEKEGKIQRFASSARIKIYVPTGSGKANKKSKSTEDKKSKSTEDKKKSSE